MLVALCIVPAAIVLSLCVTRELGDTYFSYIVMNLGYAASGLQNLRLSFFLAYSPTYTVFLAGSLLIILLGALAFVRRRNIGVRAIVVWAASLLLLLTALYVIYKPHREFPHYLLFSIVPPAMLYWGVTGIAWGMTAGLGTAALWMLYRTVKAR